MVIDEVKDYINKTIEYLETNIKVNYKQYKKEDNNEMLSKVNGQGLGQLILNKSIFETVLDCLNPTSPNYNCFAAIEPILEKLYPNKKDWLPVFGFLLSKAKKYNDDYKIIENYLDTYGKEKYNNGVDNITGVVQNLFDNDEDKESLKGISFLDNIVNDDGEFLPYMLTNYDRFMLQAVGLSFNQVSLISKHTRSLYKQEQAKKQQSMPVRGTRVVSLDNINVNIKDQKIKLQYLKQFLSLETYEIVCCNSITPEEEENIIATLEDLKFKPDRVLFIKNRIAKFNEIIANNILIKEIEKAKNELFTNEMHEKYQAAKETLLDANVVYTSIKEQIRRALDTIDDIIINYVNKTETKDDTCEYLLMAFEDLNYSLKLCGPVKKRTL